MSRRVACQIVLLAVLAQATFGSPQNFEDPDAVIIPLDIEINGKPHGELITRATPSLDAVAVFGPSFKELLLDKVADDIALIVASLPDEYIALAELNKLGLRVHLDLERLVLVVEIQEKLILERRSISLNRFRNRISDRALPEAKVSGYANFRMRSAKERQGNGETHTRNTLNVKHVMNFNGWAIVGESVMRESDSSAGSSWSVESLHLEKDVPKRLWRIRLGDLVTPTTRFQRGFSLWGFNLSRNFDISPSRIFQPTGSAQFELREDSTVEVLMNGNVERLLKLDPGIYNIEDFKLAAGENTLALNVISDSGAEELVSISEFGAPTLLGNRVSEYSFSFGLPVTSNPQDSFVLSSLSQYQRRLSLNPVYSGYYRKGVTNQITGEVALQGTLDWQRAGVSAIWANQTGSYHLDFSLNNASSTSPGIQLSSEHEIFGYKIRSTSTYMGEGFSEYLRGQSRPSNEMRFSQSLNASKMFGDKLSASFGSVYRKYANGEDEWSANARFGRRIGDVYTSLSLRGASSDDGFDTGLYLNLTWNPVRKWRSRTRVGYGDFTTNSGIETTLNYANRRARDYYQVELAARGSEEERSYTGGLTYQNNMIRFSALHGLAYGDIQEDIDSVERTSLELEWAIAFADGSVGVTRRVGDAFALIANHQMWKDVPIGINPTLGGYEFKSKGGFFSPVISNLRPYQATKVFAETSEGEMILQENEYEIAPSEKRGTKIVLGDEAVYGLRSSIFLPDGEPAVYRGIHLTDQSGNRVASFTNSVGRFVASGLKEGIYTISVAGTAGTAQVEIKGKRKLVNKDMIVLEVSAQ